MRRIYLCSLATLLLLAMFLSPSPVRGLSEPPPPPPVQTAGEEGSPDDFVLSRLFDERLVGPGWLTGQGTVEGQHPPKTPAWPVASALRVVAGFNHACALTDAGGVRCWGDNYLGQLGDGARTYRTAPVDVLGLTSGVLSISASHNHTCALTEAGGVKCWGYNRHGELGDGTTINSLIPVDVYGLNQGVIAIAAGGFHTCALLQDGAVKCWGANWHGQVGDGTTLERTKPVDVVNMESGVQYLTTGKFHTCAVIYNNSVKCWGYNRYGQQGNGSLVDNLIPKKAIGMGDGAKSVFAGGLHTCAVRRDDKVMCWGDNSEGQLGDGTNERRIIATWVFSIAERVTEMSLGSFHTCALLESGALKCWGDNWAGQLGNTTTIDQRWPIDVAYASEPIQSVASGDSHTCAVTASGNLLCWGSNGIGQLGNGGSALSLAPVDVDRLTEGGAGVQAGGWHACALTSLGGVKCWGDNKYGQLGDGTTASRLSPVDVVGLESGVSRVDAGAFHTCAVLVNGGLKCWGENFDGQLGDGTTERSLVPTNVIGLGSDVVEVTSAYYHTCALTAGGGVKCWGRNGVGRLGDGTVTDRLTPVDVIGLESGVVAIRAGSHHTCALKQDGEVRCWGANSNGQLGDGSAMDRLTPVAVSGLGSGVVSLAAGDGHTCALKQGGEVRCWGGNYSGQLGDGTGYNRYTPVDVIGLAGPVYGLEAGEAHTCAILIGGSVQCWGDNWTGQLGDESTTERLVPTSVTALQANVAGLAAGGKFTCALTREGSLKCWGAGEHGQLGSGAIPWTPVPSSVIGFTPPHLAINHLLGRPGSYFTLHGEDFLPDTVAAIRVNGYGDYQAVPVNPEGAFDILLSTDQADLGDYFLTVEAILQAGVPFRLMADAPLHPLEGTGPVLVVPPGIAYGENAYLAISLR